MTNHRPNKLMWKGQATYSSSELVLLSALRVAASTIDHNENSDDFMIYGVTEAMWIAACARRWATRRNDSYCMTRLGLRELENFARFVDDSWRPFRSPGEDPEQPAAEE